MSREPVSATPRKGIAKRKRLEVFIAQKGRCALCQAKRPMGEMQLDHRIPLAIGGKDEPANWQWICTEPCHALKTKQDVADIAKAKRREAKANGTFPATRAPIRSRGFPKGRNRQFAEASRG